MYICENYFKFSTFLYKLPSPNISLPQIDYPEIVSDVVPKHRFMSAYEQRIEPPDKKWQYLLFAAEPYETIAFKVRGKDSSLPFFLSICTLFTVRT